LSLQDGKVLPESFKLEEKLHGLCAGGNLSIIELGEEEYVPKELLPVTKQVVEKHDIEFFTYNRNLTYCTNCRRSWFGPVNKCPLCGAVSTLKTFNRFAPN
jgi:anaerobic ribonucleoside-triphosphate reductase